MAPVAPDEHEPEEAERRTDHRRNRRRLFARGIARIVRRAHDPRKAVGKDDVKAAAERKRPAAVGRIIRDRPFPDIRERHEREYPDTDPHAENCKTHHCNNLRFSDVFGSVYGNERRNKQNNKDRK